MTKGQEGENPAGDLARYKNQTLDHREEAYEAVARAEAQGVSARACVNPPEIVRVAHVRALNYADQLRPKKGDLPEAENEALNVDEPTMWHEILTTVEVPKEKTYDAGYADLYGEYSAGPSLDYQKRVVSPATVNTEWADTEVAVGVRVKKRHGGATTETTRYEVYLPLYATRALLNHLDDCMDNFGWLPETHEKGKPDTFTELSKNGE